MAVWSENVYAAEDIVKKEGWFEECILARCYGRFCGVERLLLFVVLGVNKNTTGELVLGSVAHFVSGIEDPLRGRWCRGSKVAMMDLKVQAFGALKSCEESGFA